MNDALDSLNGQGLPELPPDFRRQVEARVRPMMRRRRRVRRVRSVVGCAVLACLAYLYCADPWGIIGGPGPAEDTKLAMGMRDSGGPVPSSDEDPALVELLEARRKLEARRGRVSASMAFMPIQTVIEWSDCVIQGTVEEVAVDRARLSEDLRLGRVRPLFLTIRLRVVESYPPLGDKRILVSSPGDLERMRAGASFLMALRRGKDTFRPMYGFGAQGVYRIQGEGAEATVSDLVATPRTMSVRNAWDLIRRSYDKIHGDADDADTDGLESTLDTLRNGSLEDATLAMQLSVAGGVILDADSLVEAMEVQYEKLLADDIIPDNTWVPADHRLGPEVEAYRDFVKTVLRVLHPVATRHTVDRLLALYIRDMSNVHRRVFGHRGLQIEFFRFALKHPGPERRERVLGLLGTEVDYYGENGNRLGGTVLVKSGYRALALVAGTPGDDMEDILKEALKNNASISPEAGARLLQSRESGGDSHRPTTALTTLDAWLSGRSGKADYLPFHIKLCVQPGDTDSVAAMQRLPVGIVADLIWFAVPDPAFVPALREAIGHDSGPLLEALHACGEGAEATLLAGELLQRPIDESSLDGLWADVTQRCHALRYLGRMGSSADAHVLSLIMPLLSEEILAQFDEAQQCVYEAALRNTEPKRRGFLAYRSVARNPLSEDLETSALLALTRLDDPGVAQVWRDIYLSDDIPRRMTAAIALHYLGDSTAEEYVEAFRNHAEFDIRELHIHTALEGWTKEFQRAVMYLRSPITDALFLDRIDQGLDNNDREPLENDLAFVTDYAESLLPVLARHLESKDRDTRNVAHSCLESLLGVWTDWDDMALAGTQPDAVARLRAAVDAFLGTGAG